MYKPFHVDFEVQFFKYCPDLSKKFPTDFSLVSRMIQTFVTKAIGMLFPREREYREKASDRDGEVAGESSHTQGERERGQKRERERVLERREGKKDVRALGGRG
eukprot:48829-Amorphochlora_amoeboformis.AAC.1